MTNLQDTITEMVQGGQYEEAASKLAQELGLELIVEFLKFGKHFPTDNVERDIYKCTLSRNGRTYTFNFGQSTAKSELYYMYGRNKRPFTLPEKKKDLLKNPAALRSYVRGTLCFDLMKNDTIHIPEAPNMYEILCCLQKYDVGTFEEFCGEFGYDTDSKTADRTYKGVTEEWTAMQRLFSDAELEILHEIQ